MERVFRFRGVRENGLCAGIARRVLRDDRLAGVLDGVFPFGGWLMLHPCGHRCRKPQAHDRPQKQADEGSLVLWCPSPAHSAMGVHTRNGLRQW